MMEVKKGTSGERTETSVWVNGRLRSRWCSTGSIASRVRRVGDDVNLGMDTEGGGRGLDS